MSRALLAIGLMLWANAAPADAPGADPAQAPPGNPDTAADDHLEHMRLTLSDGKPYRFELHYRGPTMPFHGPLCYAFAGYNETCTRPRVEWLTPATAIELWAPGGVPRELLLGYVMTVRYPALSQRTFRYQLTPGNGQRRIP
jgi:hypothetical protein